MSKQSKFDSKPTLSYSIGFPSLPMFVTGVHGIFYSYNIERTCSELHLVELRLSFIVEVMTASGNWKHPLPLKNIFDHLKST